jgi:hypothetical protein
MDSGLHLPLDQESTPECNAGDGSNDDDITNTPSPSNLKQPNISLPQSLHNTNELNAHPNLESEKAGNSSQDRHDSSQDMSIINYAPNTGPAPEIQNKNSSTGERRNRSPDSRAYKEATCAELPVFDVVSTIAFCPY